MLKTKNAKIISSLIFAMIIILCLPNSVSAHSVFIVADSSIELGQEVRVTVAFGHYPEPVGELVRDSDVSWSVSVLRPDGTEQVLDTESVENGENQYITASFIPESIGFYQVVWRRDRGVLRARQQNELVKSYVRAGGVNTLESLVQTTGGGRLEIRAVSDISSLYWENEDSHSVFEGQMLFMGEPLANTELILEDVYDERTHFQTDSEGRFGIVFPGGGAYALIAEHIDESGESVIRDSHIVMLDVAGEAPSPPSGMAAAETGGTEDAFSYGDIIILSIGGALLLGAGYLFGITKRKAN